MTRKDYVLLAIAISNARQHASKAANAASFMHGVEAVTYDIANTLAAENPRFDRERFLKACGVSS